MKKILIIILLSTLGAFAQSSTMLLLFGDDFEPETQLYLSSLTTPLSYDQQVRLNTFVKMVKDSLQISALSSKFDVMYLLANETAEAGLKNLVKRQHDATAVNSPTFTQWEGFTGNGTSSYLNTNYNPSSQAVNVSLATNSIGVYSRTNSVQGTIRADIGFSSDCEWSIFPTYNAGSNVYCHALTSDYLVDTLSTNNSGFWISNRIGTDFRLYINGSLKKSQTTSAALAIPSLNVYVLARNVVGIAAQFSNRQLSFAFIGAGLTTTEVSKLTNCIEWYMDSVNRGVIP